MTTKEINKTLKAIEQKRCHIKSLEARIRYCRHVEEDYNKDRTKQIASLVTALERTKEAKKELEKLLKSA